MSYLQLPDSDPAETQEWIDSLHSVARARGTMRATILSALFWSVPGR